MMNPEYTINATQYFTATIYEWQPILVDDMHKNIIIESLQYLVYHKRIELNAFVVMSNPRLNGRAGYSFNLPTGL